MKHTFHTFIAMMLLGWAGSGCRQASVTDSVFAEAEGLMYTHPDSALKLIESIPNPELLIGKAQADYALLMTQAKSRNQIWATSDSLIRIAVDYYQNSNEMEQKAKSLLYLGDVLMDMERYADATQPLKQAEGLMEYVKDPHIQSLVYSMLAYVNKKAVNYGFSFSYYKKSLTINQINKFNDWYVSNIINILSLPIEALNDSSLYYIELLEEITPSVQSSLQTKAYNNIGTFYKDQDNKEKAMLYFEKAIETSEGSNYKAISNLADIYHSLNETFKADSLYQIALQSPNWAVQSGIYEYLYKRKLSQGQTEEAVKYMNQYIEAVDSFYYNREASQIQEIQQKYDQEVILRKKDQMEIWLYRAVVGFTAVIAILLTIAWYLRKKHRAHLQVMQEQINKIILSSEADKEEISKLNEMLAQSKVIKQNHQLSSIEDIQALEFYLRFLQAPESYHAKNDFLNLQHWVNLVYNNFAHRLKETYPSITPTELTICYLQRMGYTHQEMAIIMHVKEDTIKRNIYRACTHLNLKNDKLGFASFIASF